jgi:hypothetical protein
MVTIACPCPPMADGSPRHETDRVTLRERLGFRAAEAIRNEIAIARNELDQGEELATGEILAILTEGYILHGVESWSLADDKGDITPNRSTIRAYILDRWDIAPTVADAADEAFSEAVMLPLLNRASTSSRPTPTSGSTSASPPRSTRRRTRSSRSSTSGTPTAVIARTTLPPAGGSRSSPSSESAA